MNCRRLGNPVSGKWREHRAVEYGLYQKQVVIQVERGERRVIQVGRVKAEGLILSKSPIVALSSVSEHRTYEDKLARWGKQSHLDGRRGRGSICLSNQRVHCRLAPVGIHVPREVAGVCQIDGLGRHEGTRC